ncbi:alkaline shock response membrane anchor protein AmaP [Actinacidiphila sp. ITFR-21]|uniref:alkaline shock response membrane anchor protein AmaP n=1 Tax=Actinacidiphila sp. ITFR-21 TaxID=3075199 RepID=UPI00288BF490|nr:alkaline shock response membrane anchor protein AmaP [Streptomyces sp. ITFR-21]WNI14959.1 alkaline shock response membrane anchor protein AmaP [Streptomyces sp. ITFR-21]
MRTTVNRVLLAVTGLVLLALGLAVLIGGLDLQRHWDFTLPSAWPFTGPKDVLLTAHDRTRYRSHDWWWPVVIAALGVVFLVALWWLLAQARTKRLRQLAVDSGDGQGAQIRGRALESVLTAESEAYDGVEWAGATLVARRGTPSARLVLGLAPHATPQDVVAGLDGEVLAHARASAGLDELPAEARLRAVRHRARRVS